MLVYCELFWSDLLWLFEGQLLQDMLENTLQKPILSCYAEMSPKKMQCEELPKKKQWINDSLN